MVVVVVVVVEEENEGEKFKTVSNGAS